MDIVKYKLIPEEEFLSSLRETKLKGYNQFPIYRDASIDILEQVDPNILVPPQRYILSNTLKSIIDLYKEFESLGLNIFTLRGCLFFWLKESDVPIPFLPPIVEESTDENGKYVAFLINDGMHRVSAARKLNKRINIVHVRDIPSGYPYYAYPFMGGWDNVQSFDELPDNFEKKHYRNPNGYKQLFRMFNDIFPGVQADRKNSNPSHLKE